MGAVLDQFKKAEGVECAERVLPMAKPTVKMTPYSPRILHFVLDQELQALHH